MSVAAAQAAAFIAEVKQEAAVWAIKDENGFPAPQNGNGERAMPVWSKESRAVRIIQNVPAFGSFTTYRLTLDEFQNRWLPGSQRMGCWLASIGLVRERRDTIYPPTRFWQN
ncbi:MAG: DUF2750 domain-containing protein [Novosphingobium sp.]|uniref:DUF2750 domain-containing protein n=1 Tax=Novosphingobium sp. TaxID=1874826 RepID=UPI0032B80066